jgi:hypothetical protein
MAGQEIAIQMLITMCGIIAVLAVVAPMVRARIREEGRDKVRKMYERITLEKLGIVREAIAMGYKDEELKSLDNRLTALIGQDEMKRLMDDDNSKDVGAADAMAFVERLINGGAESGKPALESKDLQAVKTTLPAERERQ